VLHPHLPVGDFTHARIAPAPLLAGWVEHFWSVSWDLVGQPPQVQETLPHPNVHLVVEAGRSAVFGVHSGRFTRVLEGRGRVFGIKFKPRRAVPLRAPAGLGLDGPFARAAMRCSVPDADTLEPQVLACADAAAWPRWRSDFCARACRRPMRKLRM
jgi:hypothetical protein